MIQCLANMKDGRLLVLIGISAQNVEYLKQGKPIDVDPAVFLRVGPTDTIGGIVLFYGETEGAIAKMMEKSGLITPETIVQAVPKGSSTPS